MVEYGQLSSEAGSFPGTVLSFPPRFPIWLLEFAVFLQLSLEFAAKERKGEYDSQESLLDGEMSLSYSKISLTVFVTLRVCVCVCVCASTHMYMVGGRGRESEDS